MVVFIARCFSIVEIRNIVIFSATFVYFVVVEIRKANEILGIDERNNLS